MLDSLAALVKALLYAALLVSAGVVFAQATLRSFRELESAASQLMRRAAIGVVVLSIAGVLVMIARLGGEFDEPTLTAMSSSTTGAALFMQLTGASLLLSASDPLARGTRFASASLLTLSLGFNGHASTVGPFEGVFAFLHASAAAWWLGSLFLLRHASGNFALADVASVVRGFSSMATKIVGALVFSGLLLIYALADFDTFPWLSAYERNLTIKLFFVAIALALATYNKFRLTPRLLNNDSTAVRGLTETINAEILVIAVVLIMTAILTTFTSPHENG